MKVPVYFELESGDNRTMGFENPWMESGPHLRGCLVLRDWMQCNPHLNGSGVSLYRI